jgi:hypothetical protein
MILSALLFFAPLTNGKEKVSHQVIRKDSRQVCIFSIVSFISYPF